MSHFATNWAIGQRGLKPATKLVLWHLCDRHNPDKGCFPSQEKLADDCEMSRSALNSHLNILEQRGLIRREQRIDPRTKRQEPTRYIFAFEPEFHRAPEVGQAQDVEGPCPESAHGAVSGISGEPCPDLAESRVRIPDTNPVREPVREPPERAGARGGGDFEILWSRWPETHRPDNRDAARAAFSRLPAAAQADALAQVERFCRLMAARRQQPRMFAYLRQRLFLDLVGDIEFDGSGRFIIRPKMPEWSEWLGSIRRAYGERAVESSVRHGLLLRMTRWPEPEREVA